MKIHGMSNPFMNYNSLIAQVVFTKIVRSKNLLFMRMKTFCSVGNLKRHNIKVHEKIKRKCKNI